MKREENALPQKSNQYFMKANNFSTQKKCKTRENISKNILRETYYSYFYNLDTTQN